jgi:HlyD family secretion protein
MSLTAASCDDQVEVTLAQVGRATVSEVVEAPASITARSAMTLTSPANGTLAQLLVNPGATVTAGQTIAIVDSAEAQTRLAQADAALKAAKRAGGGGSKVNLGGLQKTLDEQAASGFAEARAAAGVIANPEHKEKVLAGITSAEQKYAGASQVAWQTIKGVERGISSLAEGMRALGAAQVMQAQQAYDLAKANVDALVVKAPIAGIIQLGGAAAAPAGSSITDLLSGFGAAPPAAASAALPGVSGNVVIGAPISTGTAIVTIVDMSQVGLVAEVDETDILLVKTGLPADAELDAAPGEKLTAEVTAIDLLPTANSRGAVAYKVHLTVKESTVTPRPGMSALIRLKVREAAGAITVPAASVFSDGGVDTVWVKGSDGKAVKRRVEVGVAGREALEITIGLTEGDWIVVRGADKVTDGAQLP